MCQEKTVSVPNRRGERAERYRMFELLSDYFNLMCVLHGQEDKQSYQAFCSRHSGANPLSDPTETRPVF